MKVWIVLMSLLGLLPSCSGNKKTIEPLALSSYDVNRIEISLNGTYYDSIISQISDTSFVILNEDSKTMFSYVDKIITYNKKYYILDQSSLRTVVSFTKDGKPESRYGRVGQGPGEYVFPWDIDVDETGVYILDTNSKKVIHYTEQGIFLGEKRIPFFADGFKRLKDGNFIFNTTPDGKQKPCLVYTDSLMNLIGYATSYQEGYVGGCSTSDIFRNSNSGICFYRSPSDSLAMLDEKGKVYAFMVFNFLNKAIPEKAKRDYLAFRRSSYSNDYLRLVNNPIAVSDSIWIGLVEDGSNQYTIIFNPLNNQCGCRKFTNSSSVYDMIEPMFSNGKGTVASLISADLEGRCRDFETLPDTVRNALADGKRVLLIHKFPI